MPTKAALKRVLGVAHALGKVVYSNRKVTNGVRYTDEYRNTNERSKLLGNPRKDEFTLPSSSTTKMVDSRSSSKFSRNKNLQYVARSLEKESGNSYSVGNLMNSHSGIRNSRRNIKVTNSIVFQRGLFSSKLDTSDIVKDIELLEKQLENIESSYLQSVQEQSSSDQQENNADTQNVSNPIKTVNYDDAIKQLIETNKLTLSRLRKVNELISSSVEKLDRPDSPDNNAIIKENELSTM